MARRFSAPYQSEPFSGLATWARNLAVFSVDRGRGLHPHRPLRLPGDEAGDCDLLRRARLRGAVDPDRARRLCRDLAERHARHGAHPARLHDRRGRARLSRPISPCNTASCRRSTTSPPTRSTRRASRRWRGCAPATAPTRPSMPGSIPPSSSARPIPTSSRSKSRFPPSAPMRSRCARQQAQMARHRRAAAAAAAPHRPHRGGGAHADHGFSRGRFDPRRA